MQNPDQQEILKLFKQYSRDPIECKNCHKQFTPIHPSQVFCCKECAKEHHTQNKVTKSEEKFNKGRGRVYSLDMSSWNWKRKKH